MNSKSTVQFRARMRPCNLCGRDYLPHSVFSRFCPACRKEELIHFAEWLPHLTDGNVRHPPHRQPESLKSRLLKEVVA